MQKYIQSVIIISLCIFAFKAFGQKKYTWYPDIDGDGWGNSSGAISNTSTSWAGFVLNNLDCDDNRWNQSAWKNIGKVGFASTETNKTALVMSRKGMLHLAYADSAYGNKITVLSFDGTTWRSIGQSGFSSGTVAWIDMVVDLNNVPYVAFQDGADSNKITVMKYDGASWSTVGNAGFSSGEAKFIKMAIDDHGIVYVVYQDAGNGNKAKVMKYNGTNWITVGGELSAGRANYTNIAIDHSVPYVVYQDSSNGNKATVMKYNGTNWAVVGWVGFSEGEATWLNLIIDDESMLYVSFADGAHGNKATVMKCDGGLWWTIGSMISAGEVKNLFMSIGPTKTLYLTYIDEAGMPKASMMRQWSSSVDMVTDHLSKGTISAAMLVVDSMDIPRLAFIDMGDSSQIRVIQMLPEPLMPEINISAIDTAIGIGRSIVFHAYSVGSGNMPVYTWYKNGVSIENNNSDIYITNALIQDDTIYCQLISNTSSCYLEATVYSNKIVAKQKHKWYRDSDEDGWGTPAISIESFVQPVGYVINKEDCDDARPQVSRWDFLGKIEYLPIQRGFKPDLLLDSAGTPFIVFTDEPNQNKATVLRFDGTNWQTVGQPNFTPANAYSVIAIAPSGTPYIGFSDYTTTKAAVMKYNGSSWSKVGADLSDGAAYEVHLLIDKSGVPYISYIDEAMGNKITVKKYNGIDWVLVGERGFSDGKAFVSSLALDAMGNPYVAYADDAYGRKATVMKFNGNSWVPLGIKGFTPWGGISNLFTQITIDQAGVPYLIYMAENGTIAMRYDGKTWGYVGMRIKDVSLRCSLTIDAAGILYVASFHTIKKFDGRDWVDVKYEGITSYASETKFTTDKAGVPYIAYYNSLNGRASVMKLSLQLFSAFVNIMTSDTSVTKDSIIYMATPVNGGTNPIYKWYINDSLIAGANSSIYIASMLNAEDTVMCAMISSDECVDTVPVYSNKIGGITVTPPDTTGSDSTVGINNLYASTTRIALYPIPAKEILNIQWSNTTTGKSVIKVYDMTGKEVLNGVYTLSQTHEMVSLPLNGLAPGAYFIKATLNGELVPAQKFIKN